jgi:hypothetical protein
MSHASALVTTRDAEPDVLDPGQVSTYWLGGQDQQLADRTAARELMADRPELVAGARANRAFGRRVTWYAAAQCGIRQFLDIGAGLPEPGATHEIAHRASPTCRVVYADNDPLVAARARTLLPPAPPGGARGYLDADVRDPISLLAGAAGILDFSQPVAVLLLAVLHLIANQEDPAGIVANLASGLPPGSMIAISHLTADHAPPSATAGPPGCGGGSRVSVYPRTRGQVTGLLGSLAVEWPGIVPVTQWRQIAQEATARPVEIRGAVDVTGAGDMPSAVSMHGGVARLYGPRDHYRRNAALELAAAHRRASRFEFTAAHQTTAHPTTAHQTTAS